MIRSINDKRPLALLWTIKDRAGALSEIPVLRHAIFKALEGCADLSAGRFGLWPEGMAQSMGLPLCACMSQAVVAPLGKKKFVCCIGRVAPHKFVFRR